MTKTLHAAAWDGDLPTVEARIAEGADLAALDAHGWAPLHRAMQGCDLGEEATQLRIIDLLLAAGAPLEQLSRDGRTPLYIAAEFCNSLAPVLRLLEVGADPNVRDAHGNHIVVNANTPEVQAYLSAMTGYPVPPPRKAFPPVKLSAQEWKSVKQQHIDPVFAALGSAGLIALQDAGPTQEAAFAACEEELRRKDGREADCIGFCFYTRQDLNRARRSSLLPLGFWGAPDGSPEAMERVGRLIVEAVAGRGLEVDWNGSGGVRPTVYLQKQ